MIRCVDAIGMYAVILLWAQLISGGSVTGTIRAQNGGPASNVRVVAMAVPDSARRAAQSATFESITQTDAAGRYRLDNISPGRYYIAAGPVATQTFHPGTLTQGAASIVQVTRASPALSGVDFTLNTPPLPTAAQGAFPPLFQQAGGITCCRLQVRFVTEDRTPLPQFPTGAKVVNRGGASQDARFFWDLGYIPLSVPLGTTADIAIEGLPPGYVLKSVSYGGKDFGLTPFKVDGQSLGTLDLTLGYEPVSTLKKVSARGKVINAAAETKVTNIRMVSTMPSGPVIVTRAQPDGSFEFTDIPVGGYRAGIIDPKGGANTSPDIFWIRDAVSNLVWDLHNNPFPEFYGNPPDPSVFTNGKSAEITGVITQSIVKIGKDPIYFRMKVKDRASGAETGWAVFAEKDWVPKIVVGETITVPGILSTDGTNRISARPF